MLCLVAYANSFTAGFALDNKQLILRDPRVRALTSDNLQLIAQHTYWWPYGESGLYRPLTTLSYLFNFAVLGNAERPPGYHALNLLLHVTNVLLLWRVVQRMTRDRWSAAVAAAVWAVMPLSTEAVTNIVGRADLMAATASLAAISVHSWWRDERPSARWWPAITIALVVVLGALSKESAVAVLGVLLVAELLEWKSETSAVRLRHLAVAMLLPLGAWLWQRSVVLTAGGAAEFPFTDNPIIGAPFWQGRLTAVHVMWRYVALLIWPAHLSNDYSYPQITLATGTVIDWIAVVLLVGGTLAALWQLRGNRAALFFAAAAFITFLPVSNLLFATGTIMGERLVYLPSAGLAALAAIGLSRLAHRERLRQVVTVSVAIVVLAFAARTYTRNADWRDDETLWRSAIRSAPASAKAHRALAEALYDRDPSHSNLDEVISEADRAVALLEPLPDEHNTFQAFRQAGAYSLDKAERLRGNAGSSAEAVRLYSRARQLLDRAVAIASAGAARLPGGSVEPEADALRLRAAALLGLENPALALTSAMRARLLSPLHPLGYHFAAAALLAMQRGEDAVVTLMTGSLVTGDRELGQEAMSLYARGVDPEGCAVIGLGANAALNPQCVTVRTHSCAASAAAYQIFKKAGQLDRAAHVRDTGVRAFACPAELMDQPSPLVP